MSTATIETETATMPALPTLTATVTRDELVAAVTFARIGVATRAVVPILAGVKLAAYGDSLTVSGFDYETAASETVATIGNASGEAIVNAAILADVLKSMDKGATVTLTAAPAGVHDSAVIVSDGDTVFTVPALELDDYPALPEPGALKLFTVPAGRMAESVASVAPAAGRDDTLPVLTGIRVEVRDGIVTLVATNRYAMSADDMPADVAADGDVNVPAKLLALVCKAYGKGADVAVSVQSNPGTVGFITIAQGARTITARTIEGEFPRWRSLMPAPESFTTSATLTAKSITESLKRVTVAAERNMPVRFDVADGAVTLSAGTGDELKASRTVPAETVGEGVGTAFNPTYLADGVKALGGGDVTVSIVAATRPAVLTTADRPGLRYLIMPVRLSS